MYEYSPPLTPRWRPLAAGIYATSCLTQTFLLSRSLLVTAGTDGHVVFWPMTGVSTASESSEQEQGSAELRWETRLRVHQNNASSMATYSTSRGVLLVSGGDDGGLGFVLVRPDSTSDRKTETGTESDDREVNYARPPVLLPRAHASAVTACAIFTRGSPPTAQKNRVQRDGDQEEEIFVLTAGNDEWVRLWLVTINTPSSPASASNDAVSVRRLCRCKTSVADVSSMAVLSSDGGAVRVLVCGVGMEVLRVEW